MDLRDLFETIEQEIAVFNAKECVDVFSLKVAGI